MMLQSSLMFQLYFLLIFLLLLYESFNSSLCLPALQFCLQLDLIYWWGSTLTFLFDFWALHF
jgi:hypothetical protein